MKTFLIVLIALVASYLVGAGIYNDWTFFAGLEPVECVRTITALIWIFFCFAFFAWVVLTGLFEL